GRPLRLLRGLLRSPRLAGTVPRGSTPAPGVAPPVRVSACATMTIEMDLITKERDRLLQRSARVYGLSFTAVAAVCLALPGVLPLPALVVALGLLVVVAGAQVMLGFSRAIWWPLLVLVAGNAVVVSVV